MSSSLMNNKRICQVKTDSGSVINAVYAIVPANSIIPSHFVNGSSVCKNAHYPEELQPRDRESFVILHQVAKMAINLRPDELTSSISLNQGAPVIRNDGVVLNGNGRSMAILHAYNSKKSSSIRYRRFLIDHSADWGLDSRVTLSVPNPVLVRVIIDEIDDGLLDEIIHSTIGGSVMSSFEQAKIDAAKLSPADFAEYDDDSNGDLTSPRNSLFVSSIVWKLAKDNERARYWNSRGKLTADAIQRAKNAIFALAYNDDGLIDKMSLAVDEGSKNISRALLEVAPKFAKLSLQQKAGIYHSYDIASSVANAVSIFNSVREGADFKSVSQYLDRVLLFDDDPPAVKMLIRFFDDHKRSAKQIVAFLKNIILLIKQQGDPRQTFLFDMERDPLSIDALIAKAVKLSDNQEGIDANLVDHDDRAFFSRSAQPVDGGVDHIINNPLDTSSISELPIVDEHIALPEPIAPKDIAVVNTCTPVIAFDNTVDVEATVVAEPSDSIVIEHISSVKHKPQRKRRKNSADNIQCFSLFGSEQTGKIKKPAPKKPHSFSNIEMLALNSSFNIGHC